MRPHAVHAQNNFCFSSVVFMVYVLDLPNKTTKIYYMIEKWWCSYWKGNMAHLFVWAWLTIVLLSIIIYYYYYSHYCSFVISTIVIFFLSEIYWNLIFINDSLQLKIMVRFLLLFFLFFLFDIFYNSTPVVVLQCYSPCSVILQYYTKTM